VKVLSMKGCELTYMNLAKGSSEQILAKMLGCIKLEQGFPLSE
jgi:hypothetical protein